VKRLLLVTLLFAGCGGAHTMARTTVAPPPPLGKRCGTAHARWQTLWFHASDGTRLDGAALGSGRRGVILLHESPADLCGWEPYGAKLAQDGFRVLMIDLRAYGLAGRGPRGGARGAIADLSGAVDELKRLRASKIAVVGASYGGVNALVAAPALGSRIAGVASLSGELELGSSLNALAGVRHLRVPLLIMGSREDRYLDAADARKLLRAAASPQKSLVEFGGGDHGWDLLAFSHKQRANRLLVRFLRHVTE
jgi:alpha-beta hydrolase superfamily lysophospholipase